MPTDLDRETIRDNGWKLGSCFTAKSTPELFNELPEQERSDDAIYIVVTHDCSLISPNLESEPVLECFAAVPVQRPDGAFTEAKHIRRLQVPILSDDSVVLVELQMAKRYFVSRALLPACMPAEAINLPEESKAILTRWLSNRYRTQTLPDAFNRRVSPLLEGNKKPLRKLLQKKEATPMLGVYLDLDPPNDELPDDQSYGVTLVLLYSADTYRANRDDYDAYAEEIRNCLSSVDGIEVRGVVPISDKDISVNRYRRMRRWQMDFLSFRDAADDVALIEEDLS